MKEFKAKIRKADVLLVASPEYNFSMLGVLKSAIDWASRRSGDNAFEGKPVVMMSASTGRLGGARVQYHLRQVFLALNLYPLNRPEVMMTYTQEHVDANGNLADDPTRQLIRQLLEALAWWTKSSRENPDGASSLIFTLLSE